MKLKILNSLIIVFVICSFLQSSVISNLNRVPANTEDADVSEGEITAPTNILEFCSQSPEAITSAATYKSNQLNLKFKSSDLLSPYFPFIQTALQELAGQLTIFPCQSCQITNTEENLNSILDNLYYKRSITKIDGYKNLEHFTSDNNELIKKYINQEALNYENEILLEERISGDRFAQKISREREQRQYKTSSEKIRIALDDIQKTFEKKRLPVLMELITQERADWKRSILVTQIYKENNLYKLSFVDTFFNKLINVTYNGQDSSFNIPEYGNFLIYPILTPLRLKQQWKKNITSTRAEYCADIFQFSGKAKRLEKVWGVADESLLKKIALFTPRLISGMISPVVSGRAAQKISNLAVGGYFLADGQTAKGAARLADSPLNPIAVANSAVGDVVSIIKSPIYATSKRSDRIKLCTMNLAAATGATSILNYVTPVEHILSVIDETHFTTEPRYDYFRISEDYRRNGAQCRASPIVTHEPESVVIERLECINKYLNNKIKYEFFRYNCGAYTKEIMTTAGLGFPPLINLGIGNELGLAFDKERHKNVSNGVFICNENIQNLRTLIAAIESDVVLNENFKKSMRELIIHEKLSFGSDAIIQLIASAAKSSIPESQKFTVEIIDISKDAPLEILDPITYQLRFKFPNMAKIPRDLSASASYYYLKEIKLKTKEGPSEFKRGNLKRKYIPLLKTIFGELDRPSLNWIQIHYPHAAKLYQDIYE